MSLPNMAKAATCIKQGRPSNSVLGGTEDAKAKHFNRYSNTLIPNELQAARFVSQRYRLPMPTASLIAALAGLGGAHGR